MQSVDLRTEDGHLIITSADGRVLGRWPLERVWRDDTHTVAVVLGCGGDDERLELLDHNILPELNVRRTVWKREEIVKSKRTIWLWIGGTVAFIAALIGFSDHIVKAVVQRVPLAQERKLGDLIVRQSDWKPCTLSTDQQAAVDVLMERLYKNDPANREKVRLYWVDEPVKNAFTLPGGSIYLFSGLMEYIESPEEFAGILSHEIEHVEKRHLLQSVTKGLLLTAGFNFIVGDFSALVVVDPSTAAQILSLRLSRRMENEADRGALARLQGAGISPRGMVDFFARLSEHDIIGDKLAFISTHPFTEDRARFFERAVPKDDNPFESFMPDEQWEALRSICGGKDSI